MTELYRTSDYREAVSELVKAHKRARPDSTLSDLADAIGVQRTYISRVLKGDRDFSSDQVLGIAQAFELDSETRDYLLCLHEYAKTSLEWRKRELHQKISATQMRHRAVKDQIKAKHVAPSPEEAMAALYLDPVNSLVLHALSTPKFRNSPKMMAGELGLSVHQIERALKLLIAADVIRPAEGGEFYEILRDHLHLPNESPLTLAYLTAMRVASVSQIQKLAADEKLSFSVTFTADEATRVAIHDQFLKFLTSIEALVKKAPSEDVYQINFDLFPWTAR